MNFVIAWYHLKYDGAFIFKSWSCWYCIVFQGLYLETKDEDNFTPLLCAAWKDQTDAGRSLLRYGADIKAVDKEMKTCLHWAAEMQHFEFAKMLFEHGHDGEEIIDWQDRAEQTALHYASEVGNVEVCKICTKIPEGVTVIYTKMLPTCPSISDLHP